MVFAPEGLGFNIVMAGPVDHSTLHFKQGDGFEVKGDAFATHFDQCRCVIAKLQVPQGTDHKSMDSFLAGLLDSFRLRVHVTSENPAHELVLDGLPGTSHAMMFGPVLVRIWIAVAGNDVILISYSGPIQRDRELEEHFLRTFKKTS